MCAHVHAGGTFTGVGIKWYMEIKRRPAVYKAPASEPSQVDSQWIHVGSQSLWAVYRWTRFVKPNGPCIDCLGYPRKSQGWNEQWDSHWGALNAFQLVVLLTLQEQPEHSLFTRFAQRLFLQQVDVSVWEVLKEVLHVIHCTVDWL